MALGPCIRVVDDVRSEDALPAPARVQQARLPAVDVFKIDIDSFDCDVTPQVWWSKVSRCFQRQLATCFAGRRG